MITLEDLSFEKLAKVIGTFGLVFIGVVLTHIVYSQHQERQMRLKRLDESAINSKILTVEKKTVALKKAAQLHPVWENWQRAQDVAAQFGVTLSSVSEHSSRNQNTWVGSMTGKPLLVLAIAKHVQHRVASQVLTVHCLGSRAKLEIAVFGTSQLGYESFASSELDVGRAYAQRAQ